MNEREKAILTNNRKLLARNIIWTDTLARRLVESGLLTSSVIRDIQGTNNREEKVTMIIEHLSLPGGYNTLQRFCDDIHIVGHELISDFLRSEGNRKEEIDVSEIFTKFPAIERHLSDVQKRQLSAYIAEKVKEICLFDNWSNDPGNKHTYLDIKEVQIAQLIDFQKERESKERIIRELGAKLEKGSSNVAALTTETRRLQDKILSNETNYTNKLQTQIKFNMAGESSVSRVQNRMMELEKYLDEFKMQVCHGMGVTAEELVEESAGVLELEMKAVHSMLDSLFLKVGKVDALEKELSEVMDERRWILLHMGFDPDVTNDLMQAYKQTIVKNDEYTNSLQRQITGLTNARADLKEISKVVNENKKDDSWEGKLIESLKKESQEMKTKLVEQSKKISELERDVSIYKYKNKNSRSQRSESTNVHATSLNIPSAANVFPTSSKNKLQTHTFGATAESNTVVYKAPMTGSKKSDRRKLSVTEDTSNRRFPFVDYEHGLANGDANKIQGVSRGHVELQLQCKQVKKP